MKKLIRTAVAVLVASATSVFADVVILKHGQVISGTVLQNDEKGVLIQLDYGTMTYPQSQIKDVKVEKMASAPPQAKAEVKRIPGWQTIIARLSKKTWALPIRQIPATVINTGVLRNVPYISFKCEYDYEVNVYGDLDNPAGVEIGIQRKLLNFEPAKANCIEFVASILPQETDKEVLKRLNLKQDFALNDGIKFEVTPPTADDAFGGWWVSVYDEVRLETARASEVEMREITQTSTIAPPEPEPARPPVVYQSVKTSTLTGSTSSQYEWASSDFGSQPPIRSYSGGNHGGGGSVYVRGYTRRDGAYVRPHTRRR